MARKRFLEMAMVLAMLLLAACGTSEPSRLYTLSALPDRSEGAAVARAATPAVGVGPVTLPQYLDRPQIVERTGPNRLEIAEFDRWAGDLKKNLEQVLARIRAIVTARATASTAARS